MASVRACGFCATTSATLCWGCCAQAVLEVSQAVDLLRPRPPAWGFALLPISTRLDKGAGLLAQLGRGYGPGLSYDVDIALLKIRAPGDSLSCSGLGVCAALYECCAGPDTGARWIVFYGSGYQTIRRGRCTAQDTGVENKSGRGFGLRV